MFNLDKTIQISYFNTMSSVAINGGDFRDILESGIKSAGNKDVLKSVAISGLTSGITTGITSSINKSFNNVIERGKQANATLTQQLASTLYESTISTTTSSAIQSAINGDSFTKSLKRQLVNAGVGALANVGAKQIGKLSHGQLDVDNNGNIVYREPQINKATQLLLHAGLGAATNKLTGNDALSGAFSGIIGELTGEYLKDKGYNKQNGSEIAGLASGISNLFIGKLRDLDSDEISDNVYSGYRVGKNASENNNFFEDITKLKDTKDKIDNGYYSENDDGTYGYNEYDKTGDDYRNSVKNINVLLALNGMANGIPTLPGVTFFDYNLDAGLSFQDGLYFNVGGNLIVVNFNNGMTNEFLGGDLNFNLNFNYPFIGGGASVTVNKTYFEIYNDGEKSLRIMTGYGAGFGISGTGISGGLGTMYGIEIKNENGAKIEAGKGFNGSHDLSVGVEK